MSDTVLSITIEGDSEGYVIFECPYCGTEFKLNAGEYQSDDFSFEDLFCPYCGLTNGKDSFISSDVIEQAKIISYNYMVESLNNSFKKMCKSTSKKGLIKMEYRPLKKLDTKELTTTDSVESEFVCKSCEHKVKVLHYAGMSKIYCPYCGVDL